MAVKRELKSKGEKERYKHLNAEFQSIARRDKESLPQRSMQRNTRKQQNERDQRSLQENQRYQGNISCKDGLDKDRNVMDLTEAEDIKKRWQEYTEELYKKDLHNQDNHDGVITHLKPDILECEVKWALESISMNKASGNDGIPVELF